MGESFIHKYIDYAPLYTLQPNSDIRTRQLHIWKDIILHHALTNPPFYLDPSSAILSNAKIGRKLTFFDDLKSFLVSQNVVLTLASNKLLVLPCCLPELAAEVLRWAQATAHVNVVETFAFLQQRADGFLFRGLPDEAMTEIFRTLERQGLAKLLPPSGFKILSFLFCVCTYFYIFSHT